MDEKHRALFLKLIPHETGQPSGLVTGDFSTLMYSFLRALIDYENKHGKIFGEEKEAGDLSEQDEHYLISYINTLIMNPAPLIDKGASEFVAMNDLDIEEKVNHAKTPTKFKVYKINADYRTLVFGLFDKADADNLAWFHINHDTQVGWGKAYYSMASAYGSELPRIRQKGLDALLGQISAHYEQIMEVLSTAGREYLGLTSQLSPGEIFHLERSIRTELEMPIQRDILLEKLSYLIGQRDKQTSPSIEQEIQQVKSRLSELYPPNS